MPAPRDVMAELVIVVPSPPVMETVITNVALALTARLGVVSVIWLRCARSDSRLRECH